MLLSDHFSVANERTFSTFAERLSAAKILKYMFPENLNSCSENLIIL